MIKESIQELKDIVNSEYETNIKNVTDFERNTLNQMEIYVVETQYKEIVESIK